jgi:two-component system sensor histidine kinase KdpD
VSVLAGGLGGVLPAVASAVAGFLAANWFFTVPTRTWTVGDPANLFSLFAFLAVSVAVGMLVGRATRHSAEARRARAQAEALAASVNPGHPALGTDESGIIRRIRDVFSLTAVSIVRRVEAGWETLAWAGDHELHSPGEGSDVIELSGDTSLVLLDGHLTSDDRVIMRAFAAQIVQALELEMLERDAQVAESMAATDRLRTALLGAVSHDLRTPLATIKASLTSLLETGVVWSEEQTREFVRAAVDETERLNRLVGRLLDASRIQAAQVHVFYRAVGIEEVVAAAVAGLGPGRERVVMEIPESLAEIQTDPDLLERVVANLIDNALAWSPADRPVRVSAGEVAGRVDLRISDRGPGIPPGARETVFQPFQRLGDSSQRAGVGLGLAVARGLLQAMGTDLAIEDTPGGGTTMVIEFKPAETVRSGSRLPAEWSA